MWPLAGRTVLESLRVLDWADQQFGVTCPRVAGGVSMGGDIAVALAGIDERITRVAVLVATPELRRAPTCENSAITPSCSTRARPTGTRSGTTTRSTPSRTSTPIATTSPSPSCAGPAPACPPRSRPSFSGSARRACASRTVRRPRPSRRRPGRTALHRRRRVAYALTPLSSPTPA